MNASAHRVPKTRILVVDEQPLLRAGLVQLIDKQEDLVCCGETHSMVEAPILAATLKPDLALVGLYFKDGDGLGLIKSLKSQSPKLPILVLSHQDDTEHAERTWEAGATGYLLKREALDEVLVGIRTCLSGEKYVSRATSVLVMRKLLDRKTNSSRTQMDNLTNRELQVLQMLGTGLSTKRIASELGLSSKTIETYRENLKHKLGLRGAPSLIRFATTWAEGLRSNPPAQELLGGE